MNQKYLEKLIKKRYEEYLEGSGFNKWEPFLTLPPEIKKLMEDAYTVGFAQGFSEKELNSTIRERFEKAEKEHKLGIK